MKKFSTVAGRALAYLFDDLDTDQIAPAQMMRGLSPDLKAGVFGLRRAAAQRLGQPLGFDLPQYANAPIFVTGRNFGCGSAREVAVWALAAAGVRCIVAPSFAPVFRESCLKNSVLPVVLAPDRHAAFAACVQQIAGALDFEADLVACRLTCPDLRTFGFEFDPHERETLLQGTDDVAATLRYIEAIEDWERRHALQPPRIGD